jgi:3(or 17)beta-hydroxysteroid dehydrogenase
MARLANKVAIVTGASMGIGRGTAVLFAEEGAKVVVADLEEPEGQKVVTEIAGAGHEATFMRLDVSSEEDWKRVIAETVERYGKLNVLINNAGIDGRGLQAESLAYDVEETARTTWDRTIAVNSTGVFLGMKYAIQAMKANGELCSIVNRSSVDGQVAEAGLFAYCASKGAVTVMTKAAALDVAAKGYSIRVNSVHPGYVNTPLTDKEGAYFGFTPAEYLEKVGALFPLGYVGEPIDIAYADLYLASDESRWVTGSEITVDGGWTAR